MNITAVIPARAGSRGVPNKNIRIINGHPLIYYSILNAKQSKYINDVIVTTDSDDVCLLAKYMGVNVRKRAAHLCEDSVTLDSVIYDAVKDRDCDLVVTMQPTSPTLKVETLDSAIEFMLGKGLDTVISVINQPHLSWTKHKADILPNYEKRLNRQYLPPHYLETGAFLITKRNFVSPENRFGKNIGVFEISEDEAIDIDNFNDLLLAQSVMSKPKVAIYVNGNTKRGMGHVYRTLEIADEFFVKPDIYYDINQTDINVFGNTKHNIIPVDGIYELFQKCQNKEYTVFINDILSTSLDYMIGLRKVLPKAKIVNFEDDGEGILKADLVINALFTESSAVNIKAGYKYFIAAKSFLYYPPIKINDKVKNILVTFGGADPQNYTERVLNIISSKKYADYNFTVILGRAKNNVNEISNRYKSPNFNILHDVKNMPEIMSKVDMALTSRGRTGFELALLGIPSIVMSQNAREEKHTFVSNENGFSYIGLNPSDEIIKSTLDMYLSLSKTSRDRFQKLMLEFDLRHGRNRVMSLINNL